MNATRPVGVRRHNLGLVLSHLAVTGPSSRAQIAAAVGLTKAGVSSIAADLIARRLVAEPGRRTAGEAGRPGSVLVVDGAGCAGIGLEVNVDYLAACVVDLARRTRFHRIDAAVDPRSPKRTLTRLAHVARKARDAATAQGL
ncbi:MAG: MarR family transcriptional regulator, partial [Streptosporangiales bacterium]|nr:MarR family transcriptional regulator [Streptosporangiales bacterium]